VQEVARHRPETGQTVKKMISTMVQLKNCCLGGLQARTEREGNNDLVIDLNPLFLLLFI
jgi:hypothetical protein